MSEEEPDRFPGFDRVRLVRALELINGARLLDPADDRRPLELMAGFEAVVEAESSRPPTRDPDGAHALEELRSILAREASEALRAFLGPVLDRLLEALLAFPETRLATYGSLQPGESNQDLLADLSGEWTRGSVGGTLHDRGWGARVGFPGLEWHEPGPRVPVQIFWSAALPDAWERLDAFEGSGYRRILVPVETEQELLVCNLYELHPGGEVSRDA